MSEEVPPQLDHVEKEVAGYCGQDQIQEVNTVARVKVPGACFSKVSRTFRARKASCQSACFQKLIF